MQTISQEEFKKRYGTMGQQVFSPPEEKKPSYIDRVKQVFLNAGRSVEENISGREVTPEGQIIGSNKSVLKRATGATLAAFNAVPQTVKAILPDPARNIVEKGEEKVGQAVQWAANNAGKNPFGGPVKAMVDDTKFQKFAGSNAGAKTEDALGVASDLGGISGNILATNQFAGRAQGVLNRTQKVIDTVANKAGNIQTKASNAFDTIKQNSASYPKSIADRVTMSKIDNKTQSILKESDPATFDEYVKRGQKAFNDPRELTPLEVAGEKAEKVAGNIKKDLSIIGERKSAALSSVGETRTPGIAQRQIDKLKPLLQKKLTDSERDLITKYVDELERLGKNPTAQSVDATVDKLQATLYEKSKGVAIPTTPRVKSFINKSIGELNTELKKFVDDAAGHDEYSKMNALYSRRNKMFTILNKALGEQASKGGSLMKRFFSPQDAGVKRLFAAIKEDYGIDLGKDATLARFVMETLGDTRARSLLQLPPTTASGIVGKVLEYAEKKLTSPDRVFEKAKSMTGNTPTVPDRVVQVIDGGKQIFYRIPEGQAKQIIERIDGSQGGIAGKKTGSGNWHVTAKNPDQMAGLGFEDGGIISLDDLAKIKSSSFTKGNDGKFTGSKSTR